MMRSELIIALDYARREDAERLIDVLNPEQVILKVGMAMYTRYGPQWVGALIQRGFRIFLDLKYHDIPNTVADACKSAADLGVFMLNVHALGGMKMMQAAKNALVQYGTHAPILIAVTILTSMNQSDLSVLDIPTDLNAYTVKLAAMAKAAELDGVVCSAWEASFMREHFGDDFFTVTPGIRMRSDAHDDQSRVMTPVEAQRAGSHYLVVGRSITTAQHPALVVTEVLKQLEDAL